MKISRILVVVAVVGALVAPAAAMAMTSLSTPAYYAAPPAAASPDMSLYTATTTLGIRAGLDNIVWKFSAALEVRRPGDLAGGTHDGRARMVGDVSSNMFGIGIASGAGKTQSGLAYNLST